MPKEIADAPVLDDSLIYLWSIYLDLYNATGGKISYQEVLAYCQFNGGLTPFEVDAIMGMSRHG